MSAGRGPALPEVPSLALHPLPLHTPSMAIPGALPCTRGVLSTWGSGR